MEGLGRRAQGPDAKEEETRLHGWVGVRLPEPLWLTQPLSAWGQEPGYPGL